MALSVPRSRLCNDLAYGIVEKWLISFLKEENDGGPSQLGINFFNIMMLNRQLKQIFLRLFKQNFDICLFILGCFDHCMIIHMKENDGEISALLFRDLNTNGSYYGMIDNKWLFAFLLINDISLTVNNVDLKKDLMEKKEIFCSFYLDENPKESLLRLIYNGGYDYEKVVTAGLSSDAIHKFLPIDLNCEDGYRQRIRDPEPGTIQRLFNLNAFRMTFPIELTSNASMSSAFQQLQQTAICGGNRYKLLTEHVHLLVMNVDDTSLADLFNPGALWRSIALYALDVCTQLKMLNIMIIFHFPPGEFKEDFHADLLQLLDWFKQKVLSKLPSAAKLKLTLDQTNGFGIDNRLLTFLRDQNLSVVQNNGADLLCMSYNADTRFNFNWDFDRDIDWDEMDTDQESSLDDQSGEEEMEQEI